MLYIKHLLIITRYYFEIFLQERLFMFNKNIFVLFVLFFGILSQLNGASLEFATSMNYQTNYEKAIAQGKKENKPVMLFLSSKSCPWCRKFENQTLRNTTINKKVHANFIALVLDQEDDKYPEKFYPQYIPTVLFINPKTEEYFVQSIGYKTPAKFQESLDEAIWDIKRLEL